MFAIFEFSDNYRNLKPHEPAQSYLINVHIRMCDKKLMPNFAFILNKFYDPDQYTLMSGLTANFSSSELEKEVFIKPKLFSFSNFTSVS